MTVRFSIVQDLPPSRWGGFRMPNKIPADWKEGHVYDPAYAVGAWG
jgi:hypothetical protein